MRLTPEQKRIMLLLCDAAERGKSAKLVCTTGAGKAQPIRETTTGAALVRKGLAARHENGRFEATDAGFWLGDELRIEDRLGKIPPRRDVGSFTKV